MKRLMVFVAAAGVAFGQEAGNAEDRQVAAALEQRIQAAVAARLQYDAVIIPVKTLTGDSFDRLVRMLGVFGVKYQADSQLRTILVYGPKSVTDQMRRVVEELDKPGSEAAIGRNIEMTLTLLRCSAKPPASASSLPADIEAVAKQLRTATQYKDIQIWDVIPIRLQEGKDMAETLRLPGTLAGTNQTATADIRIHAEAVGHKAQGRFVRFSNLVIDFRIPVSTAPAGLPNTQFSFQNASIRTAGDYFESQKTVLGKVSGMEDETAIFVVVALKVLD